MKAEEPGDRVRVVKYGMAAEYQDALVKRHETVMAERRAIEAYHLAHAILVAPALQATFNRVGSSSPSLPVPTAEAAPEPDLRAALGLH